MGGEKKETKPEKESKRGQRIEIRREKIRKDTGEKRKTAERGFGERDQESWK